MKNMNGWIKLHRKVFENPTVTRSPEHMAVWMYLLCHATPQPYRAIFNGKEIELKAGQLITGRDSIAGSFDTKLDGHKVQRILKCFENAHQIAQQTSNKNRLITVLNWEAYQENAHQNRQQMHNKRTTTAQQTDTYKENKENKEDKEIKESSSAKDFKRMSIEEAWEIMNRRNRGV